MNRLFDAMDLDILPFGGGTMMPSPASRGCVFALTADTRAYASEHERVTRAHLARRIARLRRCEFGGEYRGNDDDKGASEGGGQSDGIRASAGQVYLVPSDTLVGAQCLAALGVRGPEDFFGGAVPHPFVLTKAIAHPLIAPDAVAPVGWHADLAAQMGDAVLDGYTVFSEDDALRAGARLLAGGAVRVKPVRATGGRGQVVARDEAGLAECLAAMDPAEIALHGLVLEENLRAPATFSVGQVQVAGITATYYGVQRLVRDNAGLEVYGGSDLTVARGGFDALLALSFPDEIRLAVSQAQRFHHAVTTCFPDFFASRINYDVAQGHSSATGAWRSGVLEQSWRVGGASGAEIAALEILDAQPERRVVNASCFEVYGEGVLPPPNADVYFSGVDAKVGALTKYSVVEP